MTGMVAAHVAYVEMDSLSQTWTACNMCQATRQVSLYLWENKSKMMFDLEH